MPLPPPADNFISSQLADVVDPTGLVREQIGPTISVQQAAGTATPNRLTSGSEDTYNLSGIVSLNPIQLAAPGMGEVRYLVASLVPKANSNSSLAPGTRPQDAEMHAKRRSAADSLEVLRHSYQEGIVYYLGRTHLHMRKV